MSSVLAWMRAALARRMRARACPMASLPAPGAVVTACQDMRRSTALVMRPSRTSARSRAMLLPLPLLPSPLLLSRSYSLLLYTSAQARDTV